MSDFTIDLQICRQCGGLCCQGHPGAYADPHRFFNLFFKGQEVNQEFLRRVLPSLGMELTDMDGVAVPTPRTAPWGCVYLGRTGCTLDLDKRPEQCLALIPSVETLLEGEIRCEMPPAFGSSAVRERWRKFWEKNQGYLAENQGK